MDFQRLLLILESSAAGSDSEARCRVPQILHRASLVPGWRERSQWVRRCVSWVTFLFSFFVNRKGTRLLGAHRLSRRRASFVHRAEINWRVPVTADLTSKPSGKPSAFVIRPLSSALLASSVCHRAWLFEITPREICVEPQNVSTLPREGKIRDPQPSG